MAIPNCNEQVIHMIKWIEFGNDLDELRHHVDWQCKASCKDNDLENDDGEHERTFHLVEKRIDGRSNDE